MTPGWKRTLTGGLLALGILGAACSNYGGAKTTGSASAPATTTAPSKTTAPAETSAATSAAGVTCDTSAGKTAVVMQGFAFAPPKLSAKACTTVSLDNKDSATHTFTIDGTSINVNLPEGSKGSAELALAPGDYIYYCRFHGSADGTGMAGKLTVT